MAFLGQKVTNVGSILTRSVSDVSQYFDRRFFSLGIFQVWLFLVFHSSTIISFESSAYSLVYSTTIASALLMLIVGALIKYRRKARVILLVLAAISGAVSTYGLCYFYSEDSILVAWSFFLGVSVGVFIPFVGKIFSSARLSIAMRQTFLSFTLATLLYFLILGLPAGISEIVGGLLPLILLLVILAPSSLKRKTANSLSSGDKDKVREIIRSRPVIIFFVGVGLLGMAFGFSMAFCSLYGWQVFDAANRWGVFVTGVGALVYFIVTNTVRKIFDFERCFSPVAPIIAIGLLLFPYASFASSVLIILGFQIADMIVWIVFSWIAGHSGLSQRVFCIGKGSMYAGMLLGSLTVRSVAFESDTGNLPLIIASVVTYSLILAIVFIFNNSKVTLAIKASSTSADLSYIAKAIELRCEELAQVYGLTLREKEMFSYLVQGRSLPYIESAMHISHGTANSHRDHIYTKTNVHTKQELLDLFFGTTNAPDP